MTERKRKAPGRRTKDPSGRKREAISRKIAPDLHDRFLAFVQNFKVFHQLNVDLTVHLEKAILLYLEREEPLLQKPPNGDT